jgi:leucine dehydrogenase
MDFETIKVDDFEKVVRFHCPSFDADTNFTAYIAVHSTTLGPALGGCRLRNYDSDEDALQDALRLAKGMTYKNAAAGLWFGGGKCVVRAKRATPHIMRALGGCIDLMGGRYITAEDVGTSLTEMAEIATQTKYVVRGTRGDASEHTYMGLFHCIHHLPAFMNWPEYRNTAVWVQGLGKVGWGLCEMLAINGYNVYVSDLIQDRVDHAVSEFKVQQYDESLAEKIDIYAPCAMGQVIRKDNIETVRFPVICGSANNQLETDDLAERLKQRGILYCPDFLVNAGGVIGAAGEIDNQPEGEVTEHVMSLGVILENAVEMAKFADTTPLEMAKALAVARL